MVNFTDTQRLDWLVRFCGISREVIDGRMSQETQPETAALPFPAGSAGQPAKKSGVVRGKRAAAAAK